MDPETRRRLSELNKGSLKNVPLATAAEHRRRQKEAGAAGETGKRAGGHGARTPPRDGAAARNVLPVDAGALTGGREVEAGDGRFLLIERELSRLWKRGLEFHGRYCRFFDREGIAGTPEDYHPCWAPLLECGSRDIGYLDIETCGFSGTPVFLVGVLQVDEDEVRIRQYFARDYAEEGPMLQGLWDELQRFRALVTFNGKTFDYPFISERALFHRVRICEDCYHFDLLHEARRRYRGTLPDCKLQTLERYLCRRPRYGDIPGDQIPAAYHHFVQTGDAHQMQDVLHHNALDLLTMAEVILFMLQNREIWPADEREGSDLSDLPDKADPSDEFEGP